MNKTVKILSILLIAVMLVSVSSVAFAALTPDQVTEVYPDSDQNDKIKDIAGRIIGWIRNIAAVAAVVIISVLGIKYMIGSTEERADYKKSFIPLIVGILVVLAASTIAGWIWSALS